MSTGGAGGASALFKGLDPAHGAEISSQDSGDRSSSGGECEVNMGKSNISKEED